MGNKGKALEFHASFDDYAERYEEECRKGLALAGEGPDYFSALRIEYTVLWLATVGASNLRRVVDFGCGVGNSTPHFRRHLPEAALLGLDVSRTSVGRAQQIHCASATFALVDEFIPAGDQELVYCNGVFHHIDPDAREEWARWVRDLLEPGGYFALWENNPWNPGAMMVMRRIPFDRDAIPLTSPEARLVLAKAGFEIIGTRYRFYFPRRLSALRALERYAERVPFGAQYCVLARKTPM
jgi:trans-aconitate methyltransferase